MLNDLLVEVIKQKDRHIHTRRRRQGFDVLRFKNQAYI